MVVLPSMTPASITSYLFLMISYAHRGSSVGSDLSIMKQIVSLGMIGKGIEDSW